jgi:hypothetical protein
MLDITNVDEYHSNFSKTMNDSITSIIPSNTDHHNNNRQSWPIIAFFFNDKENNCPFPAKLFSLTDDILPVLYREVGTFSS